MDTAAKTALSERDICTKFITPDIAAAGWNTHSQMREEVNLTAGRVVVRGNRAARDKTTIRRADYMLYFKPGMPLAVVEAKDNKHTRTLRARLTDARAVQARLASALVDEVSA